MTHKPYTKGEETERELFIKDCTGRDAISCFGTFAFINRDAIIIALNSHDDLIAALEAQNSVIDRLQKLVTMFLEPGDLRIQSEDSLVSSIIYTLDGPEERKAKSLSEKALAKAKLTGDGV